MDKKIPRHVALIPDGNRRWAKALGKNAYYGHSNGIGTFEEVAWYGFETGVECISLWGMSADNFKKRSGTEVAGLMKIFKREFKSLAVSENIHKHQVRIRVFGGWEETLPMVVKKQIRAAVEATKEYRKYSLNIFLSYNGTDEMIRAVRRIVSQATDESGVSHETIKDNLYTKDLPPVDLVIRTGGDPHLSNGFMMWDTADAELYFTEKLWPQFGKKEFTVALEDYSHRRRRRGA